MAQTIQIYRTTGDTDPSNLEFGELAYVDGTGGLWIGNNASGVVRLNLGRSIDSTLGANGYDGNTITMTAGEAISAGDICFIQTDGDMELADANVVAEATGLLVVATEGLAADASGEFLLPGGTIRATALGTGTVNVPYYLSETPGDVTSTAPSTSGATVRVMGYFLDANTFLFQPAGHFVEV